MAISTNTLIIPDELIMHKIYHIRDQKVMLDFDLAELYDVETKLFNQAIKRNTERFPIDFMFQLTQKEFNTLRSQIVTSNRGGRRYRSFAFTEHGITMLSSVLRSEKAIKMNIAIIRAFIALRQLTIQHKDLSTQLRQLRQEMYDRFGDHDNQLAVIYNAIEKMLEEKNADTKSWEERERIGFKK